MEKNKIEKEGISFWKILLIIVLLIIILVGFLLALCGGISLFDNNIGLVEILAYSWGIISGILVFIGGIIVYNKRMKLTTKKMFIYIFLLSLLFIVSFMIWVSQIRL